MEKSQPKIKQTGACEKVYKSIAQNCPFRSNHRRSQIISSSMSGNASDSPCKTRLFLKKLVSPYKPRPTHVNIPIHHGASMAIDQKPKMAESSVSEQSNGRVIIISAPKIQPVVNPSFASGVEKKKQKAETVPAPSNIIVVHRSGQGINAIAASPQMPPVPKPKTQPATSVVKVTTAKQDEPIKNNAEYNKKVLESGDHNYKYTNYIEYVKNQLGTKSNVGEEEEGNIEKQQPTRTPTRRDSLNDRASNFIIRAKMNINKTNTFR